MANAKIIHIHAQISNSHRQQVLSYFIILQTSSAADFGQRDGQRGGGDKAGACAQGIQNSLTTRWLITASTPAKMSTPCRETLQGGITYELYGTQWLHS